MIMRQQWAHPQKPPQILAMLRRVLVSFLALAVLGYGTAWAFYEVGSAAAEAFHPVLPLLARRESLDRRSEPDRH